MELQKSSVCVQGSLQAPGHAGAPDRFETPGPFHVVSQGAFVGDLVRWNPTGICQWQVKLGIENPQFFNINPILAHHGAGI